jgi:putative glycosyltransferase (TIGR04372 family)
MKNILQYYLLILKIWYNCFVSFQLITKFIYRKLNQRFKILLTKKEKFSNFILKDQIKSYGYIIISIKNKFLVSVHRNTANLLYAHLKEKNLVEITVNSYLNHLKKNQLNFEELFFLAKYALEQENEFLVEKCVDRILTKKGLAIEYSRDFAVQLFLKGMYKNAKKVWTATEKIRLEMIKSLGLDKHKLRILPGHWFIAVGHIAHLDSYIKNELLSARENYDYYFDIPIGLSIPNIYFLELWKKLLNSDKANEKISKLTYDEIILLQDDFWSTLINGSDSALMFNEFGSLVQKKWSMQKLKPVLTIPNDEAQIGSEILSKWGLPTNAWFVCLHVRESGFHYDWHKQNPGTRNANISSYLDAIDYITSIGGYVIRMGDKSMEKLPQLDRVIDYVHTTDKTDYMDIFLCANCKFFIGTNSGLGLVPSVFGKKCLLTNWSPIAIPQWYPEDIFIPKLVRRKTDKSYLSFKEMFSTIAGWSQFQKYYNEANLEVIDNTPDEILNGVKDIIENLSSDNGLMENQLVRDFSKLSYEYIGYTGSKISPSFIKKHIKLLHEESFA